MTGPEFQPLRDNALTPRLTGDVIGTYGYRLWVPRKLLPTGLLKLLSTLPVALSAGGTFRQKLGEMLSAKGIDLNVGVETTSFTQALEALRTKSFAAILPEFANTHLSKRQFLSFNLPELKSANRALVLARRKQREDLVGVSEALRGALSLT
jgi:hypothetical protein